MFGCDSEATARASRSKRSGSASARRSLTRDRATELRVGREPDLGHRTRAELLLQPIAAGDHLAHRGSSLWAPWRADAKSDLDRGGAPARARAGRAACRRRSVASARSLRQGARRGRDGRASTCRRSTARRWTASRCARADTPGRLPVVHRIAAGSPAPRSLEAGEAMGIATGGVVPEGADAVIPFEYVVET